MVRKFWGYLTRFTVLHVLTYTVIGVLFYELQDYEAAFKVEEHFALFRPVDHPLVALAMPIQVLRGALLALLIYPFYEVVLNQKRGWLLLAGVIFGLTALGSAVFIPDFLTSAVRESSVMQSILDMVIGLPEISVQIVIFSWLLFKWEIRKMRKSELQRAQVASRR